MYERVAKMIYQLVFTTLRIFDDFIFKKKSTGILQLRNYADNAYQSLHLKMLRATTLRLESDFDFYAKTATVLQLKKIDHSAFLGLYLQQLFTNELMITDGVCEGFTDDDETPTVAGKSLWFFSNTNATNITNFDDGVKGQVIYIYFADGNTTVIDGTNIMLSSSGNKTFADGDMLVLMLLDVPVDVWVQIGGVI